MKSILAALCVAPVLVGRTKRKTTTPRVTCCYLNGKYWNHLISFDKTGDIAGRIDYIGGVMDALETYNHTNDLWPKNAKAGEVVKALDMFYEDPANQQVTILHAIYVVKLRFAGNDAEVIDRAIQEGRKLVTKCK
jgi:hypothetical protein